MSKDEYLEKDSKSIFRLYEQHRNSIEISLLAAAELESCSQALKSLATSWSGARIKLINKASDAVTKNGRNYSAPLSDNGLAFTEIDELERLNCLKNRLTVLLGCFEKLPRILTDFETQLGACFPSYINSPESNITLLNRFATMNDEEIVLRHLLSAEDVLRKAIALENAEPSASSLQEDLLNSRFTPRVFDSVALDMVSLILLRARALALAAVDIARLNEKDWLKCICVKSEPNGHCFSCNPSE